MPEIPCPFCPLINNNIQVCDVLVDMRNKNITRIAIDRKNVANDIPEVREALVDLVRYVSSTYNTKVGQYAETDNNMMYMSIEHKIKNVYKVCFHNRQATKCC
jgi:hypothetical protein